MAGRKSWKKSSQNFVKEVVNEMTIYKIIIKTSFGELTVEGETLEELIEAVKQIKAEHVASIENVLKEKGVLVRPPRQIKPTLKSICRFTSSGLVELLKIPDQKVEAIALVLFAYDPEPATLDQITKSSGVYNAVDFLTKKQYEKYFKRVKEGTYALTQEGKLWVANHILPKLEEKLNE